LPVLRNQSELPEGYVVQALDLKGRVLTLQKMALHEDIDQDGDIAKTAYIAMPDQLASLVRAAAKTNFGTQEHQKGILEFTAVAPNIRKGDPRRGTPPRYWYMLPDFALRHRPDLLIARVNHTSPKTYLNKGRSALIDANFSTLWLNRPSLPDTYALLALLNSSWCRAALELSASVMGGGALKVEATHLRRLPVPNLDATQWMNLSGLGHKLVTSKEAFEHKGVIEYIDDIVTSSLLGRPASKFDIQRLRHLIADGLDRRGKHNRKVSNEQH
jgi:hypothetical protein